MKPFTGRSAQHLGGFSCPTPDRVLGFARPLGRRDHDARGGLSNRQIARKLGLAEATLKAHLHAIFVCLQAKDHTDAVVKAFGGTLGDLRAV
ncbi:helix-turn-helix transcriptional regulator [Amycolatopsis azurea]|uniref:helix-turn-helix domain-containing protein n=1 Tax=Amycolatopsis azurea TaxID=36819 RepID=UPI00380EEC08